MECPALAVVGPCKNFLKASQMALTLKVGSICKGIMSKEMAQWKVSTLLKSIGHAELLDNGNAVL